MLEVVDIDRVDVGHGEWYGGLGAAESMIYYYVQRVRGCAPVSAVTLLLPRCW
jgi:hypothetical protein